MDRDADPRSHEGERGPTQVTPHAAFLSSGAPAHLRGPGKVGGGGRQRNRDTDRAMERKRQGQEQRQRDGEKIRKSGKENRRKEG